MERYWINEKTGFTNTTWGKNEMVGEGWKEITKEEKDARDKILIKAWALAYNGEYNEEG